MYYDPHEHPAQRLMRHYMDTFGAVLAVKADVVQAHQQALQAVQFLSQTIADVHKPYLQQEQQPPGEPSK